MGCFRVGDFKGINRLYKRMIDNKAMTLEEANKWRNNLIKNKIEAEEKALKETKSIITRLQKY